MNDSLKSTIVEINKKLEKISNMQKSSNEQNEVSKRNNNFFKNDFPEFQKLVQNYQVLKSLGDFSYSNETLLDLQNCRNYIKNVFETKIIKNNSELKNLIATVRNLMQSDWKKYLEENNIDKLNDSLAIYHLVCNNKTNVNTLINNISAVRNGLPNNLISVNKFIIAKKQAEDLIKQNKFSEPIEIFLKKVKDKQATINDLTNEVLEWIRSENIANHIQLSIKF